MPSAEDRCWPCPLAHMGCIVYGLIADLLVLMARLQDSSLIPGKGSPDEAVNSFSGKGSQPGPVFRTMSGKAWIFCHVEASDGKILETSRMRRQAIHVY